LFETLLTLAGRPGGLWFDTSSPVGSSGTASFASCEPAVWLRGSGPILEILPGPAGDRGWLRRVHAADPGPGSSYERLARIARRLRVPLPVPNVADATPIFRGGFAGCFSYDLGRRFEALPSRLGADLPWDFLVGLYDEVAVWDRGVLSWLALPGVEPRLRGLAAQPGAEREDAGAQEDPRPEMTRAEHALRVETIREHIVDGTIYQANLTLRFTARTPHPDAPLATFLRLRRSNPSPYGAYLDLPGATIASSSPESFLDLTTAGYVRSRPIKGTAPRGATPEEDAALSRALLASAKDRAELSMIVDLVRNDVGRVCVPGSVDRRPTLRPEAHPTVWHLVGEVRGRIAPGRDAFDLLRACFPPGSCIGAPKIRAMAILEDLEQSRRGPYTGALGWIGLDGAMALSVAIRTMVFRDGRVSYGVGGGIVYDSNAAAEWDEALLKGRALAGALRALDTRARVGMIGYLHT
jgi:para-aminobenzoate synthetase component 1